MSSKQKVFIVIGMIIIIGVSFVVGKLYPAFCYDQRKEP